MRSRPTLFSLGLRLVAGVFVALAAGCMEPAFNDAARVGPFFTPTNHVGEARLGGLRRVVVLPTWSGTVTSVEMAAQLDPVFATALQQQNRFEIVTLSREECLRRFHVEAVSSAGALPHDLLASLKKEFAAEAVLFIDLTAYQAYRPIVLGLRAKLATIDGARLLWTFDEVFSGDDPAVANAARHFYLESDRGGVPADLTRAVLQSPTRFAGYAATEMFGTLPPVLPPPPVAVANAKTAESAR